MNVAGIVAEYNPFHNGHLRQIRFLRERGFQGVIAVMSGNFVQRAEPALTDKYLRAQIAVESGADLILELPLPYAVAAAETFAAGGVEILHATGAVNALCCGCESAPEALEKQYAALMRADREGQIAARMEEGVPYPVACKQAVTAAGEAWSTGANDLLYLAYRKTIDRVAPGLPLIGLIRDTDHAGIGSGAFLRERFQNGEGIAAFVPTPCAAALKNAPIADYGRLTRGMLAYYRTAAPEELAERYGFREGLEYRVIRASDAPTLQEWFDRIKTKRFPHSAVRRAVLCGYLGIPRVLPPITYLRVLAFNDTGREILKQMKKTATLPVYASIPAKLQNDPLAALQLRGDEVFQMTLPVPGPRHRDRTERARYCPGKVDEL